MITYTYMKTIKGFGGMYSATKDGRIWSRYNGGRFLKPSINQGGYEMVILNYNGKSKNKTVHRLVAETFIPNPKKLPCINHLDCNKRNNCIENFEWCTYKENSQHAITNGLLDGRPHSRKLIEKQVIEIRELHKQLNFKPASNYSQILADKYGVTRTTIYNIIKRNIWSHI